jgi:tetratricopeptide (TPR) repeat protein
MNVVSGIKGLLLIYAFVALCSWYEISQVHRGQNPSSQGHMEDSGVLHRMGDAYRGRFPDDVATHYALGSAAMADQRFEDARPHFERALAYGNKDEDLFYAYAVTMAYLEEGSAATQKAIDEWKRNYPFSTRADPRQVIAKVDTPEYLIGEECMINGQFKEAREHFERDLAAGSKTEALLYNYVLTLLMLKEDAAQVNKAVEAWKSAHPHSTRRNPQSAFEEFMKQGNPN